MQPVAHGVDLVEVERIAGMLAEHGEAFYARCFTAAERDYCRGQGRREAEHAAARFAAKEAVLKALGTGWTRGIAWTDVEVVRGAAGEPGIALHGAAAAVARERGVVRWLVSLSHTRTLATASVIGVAGAVPA